jgi:hypothetical protein
MPASFHLYRFSGETLIIWPFQQLQIVGQEEVILHFTG